MCLGGKAPPKDNSAEIARQQATEREAKINEGKGKIDSAFGVFDPAYYDKFQSQYLDVYNPQIDEQFGDARKQLRYDYARKGTLDATPGQAKFGDLTEAYTDRRREAASNALDAVNKLKTSVEQNKSDLYAQNTASADPSLSAIGAVSRAGALQSAPTYSPLGDLFAGLLNSGTSYLAGQQKALPAGYSNAFSSTATGRGSERLVR